MSNFYTNVQLVKDKIYYIGYEDGRRVKERFDYSPTLYLTSQDDSEWKTLEGESVKGIKQGCVSDAKAFIDKYKDCLLYTSPSPRDVEESRMPSSA